MQARMDCIHSSMTSHKASFTEAASRPGTASHAHAVRKQRATHRCGGDVHAEAVHLLHPQLPVPLLPLALLRLALLPLLVQPQAAPLGLGQHARHPAPKGQALVPAVGWEGWQGWLREGGSTGSMPADRRSSQFGKIRTRCTAQGDPAPEPVSGAPVALALRHDRNPQGQHRGAVDRDGAAGCGSRAAGLSGRLGCCDLLGRRCFRFRFGSRLGLGLGLCSRGCRRRLLLGGGSGGRAAALACCAWLSLRSRALAARADHHCNPCRKRREGGRKWAVQPSALLDLAPLL